nr:hypothetical protein [uncultured Dongia sp.]
MPSHDSEMRLPIRLIPRRGAVIIGVVFALAWTSFVAVGFSNGLPDLFHTETYGDYFTSLRMPSFVLAVMLLVGCYILLMAILRVLPGSPCLHLEVSQAGLKHRRFFKQQNVTWAEIYEFSVVERMQRSGKSKKRHWWVLAETKDGATYDIDHRISHALLAFDANDLAPMMASGEEVATTLRDKLDDLLQETRRGNAVNRVILPPILREVAIALHQPAVTAKKRQAREETVKRTPRRSGVVER